VREAFASCGGIATVRLAIWNNTKQRKGFGYVDFARESGAQAAVETQSSIRSVMADLWFQPQRQHAVNECCAFPTCRRARLVGCEAAWASRSTLIVADQ
jgi:RNA recognition motif. (a.k.a. RRM, RBD, or RNP domain)